MSIAAAQRESRVVVPLGSRKDHSSELSVNSQRRHNWISSRVGAILPRRPCQQNNIAAAAIIKCYIHTNRLAASHHRRREWLSEPRRQSKREPTSRVYVPARLLCYTRLAAAAAETDCCCSIQWTYTITLYYTVLVSSVCVCWAAVFVYTYYPKKRPFAIHKSISFYFI